MEFYILSCCFFFHVFFHVFFFRDFTSMIVYDHEILRRIQSRCVQNEIFQYDFCIAIDPLQGFNNGFKQRKYRHGFFKVNIGDENLPSYVGINNKPSIRIPIKRTSTMEHFSHFQLRSFCLQKAFHFRYLLFRLFRLNNYKRSMNHNRSFPLEVNQEVTLLGWWKRDPNSLKGWKGDQPNDRGFWKVTSNRLGIFKWLLLLTVEQNSGVAAVPATFVSEDLRANLLAASIALAAKKLVAISWWSWHQSLVFCHPKMQKSTVCIDRMTHQSTQQEWWISGFTLFLDPIPETYHNFHLPILLFQWNDTPIYRYVIHRDTVYTDILWIYPNPTNSE